MITAHCVTLLVTATEVPEPAHDMTDGPKVHYLGLENEENNQISITSGNLALYEVCLFVCQSSV